MSSGGVGSPMPVTGSLADEERRPPVYSVLRYFLLQALIAGGLGGGAGTLVGMLASVLDPPHKFVYPLVAVGALTGLSAGLLATFCGRTVLPRLVGFSLPLRVVIGSLALVGGAFAATGVGFWLFPRYALHAGSSVLLVGAINGLLALIAGLLVFLYEDLNRRLAAAREQLVAERLAQAHAAERAARAELQALQARINPHFFFNALNTAAALIQDDPSAAERLLERFSDLFRYAFRRGGEERVSLEEELSFVADYLAIEKARFGERLVYHVDVAPEVADELVPPLIMQPLVENAVLHGRDPETGQGSVTVRAFRDAARRTLIEVRDDGPGPGEAQRTKPKGHALENIAARLTSARGGRLEIAAAEGGRGTVARVVFPPPATWF